MIEIIEYGLGEGLLRYLGRDEVMGSVLAHRLRISGATGTWNVGLWRTLTAITQALVQIHCQTSEVVMPVGVGIDTGAFQPRPSDHMSITMTYNPSTPNT